MMSTFNSNPQRFSLCCSRIHQSLYILIHSETSSPPMFNQITDFINWLSNNLQNNNNPNIVDICVQYLQCILAVPEYRLPFYQNAVVMGAYPFTNNKILHTDWFLSWRRQLLHKCSISYYTVSGSWPLLMKSVQIFKSKSWSLVDM
jgi:hypothetical protein